MNQPNKDYFESGKKHVCRFCNIDLAKVKKSSLVPLDNKAHFTILIENGIMHRSNACKQCVKSIDRKDTKLLQTIWEHDIECLKSLDLQEGCQTKESQERYTDLKNLQVVPNFLIKEIELKDSERALKIAQKKSKELTNAG